MADKALPFYDYAWTLTVRQTPEALNESMAVKYLNGLLDAGAAQKAIEVFVPLRKKLGDTAEIISLLAEAYAQVGQGEKASAMLNDLKLQLSDRESLQGKSPGIEECDWYYLIDNVYPNAALGYARKAAKDMRDVDPGMELVLGAAELRAGDATAGEKVLKKLLDRNIYAAMFLAQYYYENRKPDDGKRAILMGAKLSQPGQRGRAFRALVALADRQNVTIPPPEEAKEIAAMVEKFDSGYLGMGLVPEKYLSVKLSTARDSYSPGDPIEVEATLTNISDLDIPLGPSGLCNAVLKLQVNLDSGQEFTRLPALVWPAKRFLKAGESITASASTWGRWRRTSCTARWTRSLCELPPRSIPSSATARPPACCRPWRSSPPGARGATSSWPSTASGTIGKRLTI